MKIIKMNECAYATESEDDEIYKRPIEIPSLKGVLSKWTNYIHGWQDRFVCCKDGLLYYFRNEDELEYGCRGSVSLSKASVILNEFDFCRFDICCNNCHWYLRASDLAERQQWIDVIKLNKCEADSASLRRHSSIQSLGSGPSISSSSSFRKAHCLKEKLAELETFKNILDKQVDILQQYFDKCANCAQPRTVHEEFDNGSEVDGKLNETALYSKLNLVPLGVNGIDFKGEAITFKATTAGIQETLAHCIELMTKRDEKWQRKLEKEYEKQKKSEEHYRDSLALAKKNLSYTGSPDYEEGPLNKLTEEEFFDAVEDELDKRERLTLNMERSRTKLRESVSCLKQGNHRYTDEVKLRIQNLLAESLKLPGAGDVWELFAEEGEMKVFRRELIKDGHICDPLKAVHSINNVTARELCYYFWATDVRMEWEGTIENFNVLEVLDEMTLIIYQTHRRIWPSAQRDCLYLSSMSKVNEPPPMRDGSIPYDTWIVVNFSVEHNEVKPVPGCVRAFVEIALICQTKVIPPSNGAPIDRDSVKCDITYIANVNPGGWAPASVLRTVYKREYPKFLRRFTAYVHDKTKDKDILL